MPALFPLLMATTALALPAQDQAFVPVVTNPWFPLLPGTTWVYRGHKDGKSSLLTS